MKRIVITKFSLIVVLIIAASFVSCKKGPGDGGRASIKGKVYTVNYNSSYTVPHDSGYVGGEKVYLIYGDEIAVGDDQDSNNDGAFEFKYLRKGKYKVYVYTKTIANYLDSAIVQEVEITDLKQTIELPDFIIKTSKN
jgi:hypothetical protein